MSAERKEAPRSHDGEVRCVGCGMRGNAGDGALPRGWRPTKDGARCVRCQEYD